MGRVLAEVGRTAEALTYSRKAAAADPRGESWASRTAALLAGAGERQEADANSDWDGVLAFLDEPVVVADSPKAGIDSERLFALAAKSRAPDAMATARANLLEMAKLSPMTLVQAISRLSVLGDLDDAFKLAEGYQPGLSLSGADTIFLFTTEAAPCAANPRCMQLAARIGLLDYWRTTGKWPDFFHDPTLPYRGS
jgi:hypothetical protein